MSHAHTPTFCSVFDCSVFALPGCITFLGSTKDHVFAVGFVFQAMHGAEVSPWFLGLVMDESQVSVLTTSRVSAFVFTVSSHNRNGSLTGVKADIENGSS